MPETRLNQALARKFEAAAAKLRRFAPIRRRYLVAVSGGANSVAMLHWLHRCGYKGLVVCHVNHHLRGSASDGDARFVRNFANKMELPCWVADAPLGGTASLETEARDLRYEAFVAVAHEERIPRILLAHHADDQAETVLWNAVRGCGLEGIGGMSPESKRSISGTEMTLLRPWLELERADIRAYLVAFKLKWREDALNADNGPIRNRLRLQILPELEKTLGRPVRRALVQLAEVAREENRVLEGMLFPNQAEPAIADLRSWPVAIQRRWLMRWLQLSGVPLMSFAIVEKVRELLELGKTAKVNLPGNGHCRRTAGRLWLENVVIK